MIKELLIKHARPGKIFTAAVISAALTLTGKILSDHFFAIAGIPLPDTIMHFYLSNPDPVLAAYSPAAVSFYGYIEVLDIFIPAGYAIFFALIITYLTRDNFANSLLKAVYFFPLIAASFDYLENIAYFIYFHVAQTHYAAAPAAFFTFFKWIMILSTISAVFALTVRNLYLNIKYNRS